MTEIVLDNFDVNYDGDCNYVEGTVVSATDDSIEIGTFIRTAVHGDAYHKVDEILQRSWINWHKPGYIPVPQKSIAVLNSNGLIVDIKEISDE